MKKRFINRDIFFLLLFVLFNNCTPVKHKDYSNIELECKSLEDAILEFVNVNSENQILKERKGVIVEIMEVSDDKFKTRFFITEPARCSEQLKGIIDLNYNEYDYYLFDRTNQINKGIYNEFKPVSCSGVLKENEFLLIINEKTLKMYLTTLANLYIEVEFEKSKSSGKYELIDSIGRVD